MIETPLISVIMPVYNGANFLQESINSVLKQSYSNFELLIINDGSTDSSADVIKSFKDNRIRYFSQERKGVSAARNRGLVNMEGDFFCFLDVDDLFPPASLRSRLDVFIKKPNLGFVDGAVTEVEFGSKKIIRRFVPTFEGQPFKKLISLSDSCFCGLTWLIKRDSSVTYQLHDDLSHCEDLLFFLELSKKGGLYSYTTEEILIYRRHLNSAMSNLDGLNRGYYKVGQTIAGWERVSLVQRLVFWVKSRKIMFLSFLALGRSPRKAFVSLWK